MGLLAAVEWYLAQDHAAEEERLESLTTAWVEHFDNLTAVDARRDFPGEAGRPIPRVIVTWDRRNITSTEVCAALRDRDPAIDVAWAGKYSIYLSAELLDDSEHKIVTDELTTVLQEHSRQWSD